MKIIYCIEDINDLRYVGSTKDTMKKRLSNHKTDKKLGRNVSSSLLHLEHSIIWELETCEDDKSWEREQYWIEKLGAVNTCRGYTTNMKQYHLDYYQKNREKILKRYHQNKYL